MKVIGVMSGSSLDGIDIVLTSFNDSGWHLEASETFDLPTEIKSLLQKTVNQTATELAHTEAKFSKYIAECLLNFMGEEKADLIGIHGHTVLHLPEIQTSWQLLNGGMICSLTKVPVVSDFRNQDMALGGQGTPMAVIADRDLYPGHNFYINLGGIANISFKLYGKWQAYDLCPCNQLLNHYSQKAGKAYDEGGQIASMGKVNKNLLELLLDEEYLRRPAPKSLDNSYIQSYLISKTDQLELSTEDYLRTILEYLTIVIADTIAQKPGTIFLSGGGTKNDFLIAILKQKLSDNDQKIFIPDVQTIDYKEAILIAYCAYLRKAGKVNFVSEATGASSEVIGGALYLPPPTNVT